MDVDNIIRLQREFDGETVSVEIRRLPLQLNQKYYQQIIATHGKHSEELKVCVGTDSFDGETHAKEIERKISEMGKRLIAMSKADAFLTKYHAPNPAQ